MSRKAIDQQQPTECRNAIWSWIRMNEKNNGPLATFDIRDMHIHLETNSIRDYLDGLTKAGYLVAAKSRMVSTTYTLVNDIGVDAPRVRKDGTVVTQGQGRQQMWNTLRILRTFNHTDLAFNASTAECQVAESDAKGYIGNLCKAGYLRMVTAGKPGNKPGTGTQARYMLIPTMWSGPHPPQIQRTRQIYDPNLKKVVWSKVEGGAE